MDIYVLSLGVFTLVAAILGILFLRRKKKQSNDKKSQEKYEKYEKQEMGKKATEIQKKSQEMKKKVQNVVKGKSSGDLEKDYSTLYYGSMTVRGQHSSVTAISLRNKEILVATSKNELILYDLQRWRKDIPGQKYYVSLENNSGTAVAIGTKYYYVAQDFDKNIVLYARDKTEESKEGRELREEGRFKRNSLKSNASSVGVNEEETVVVTTGSETDVTIVLWSLSGDKLHTVNTYQLEHYEVRHAFNRIVVRGWTSEVRVFELRKDRVGQLRAVQTIRHLPHSVQPKCCALDAYHVLTADIAGALSIWSLATGCRQGGLAGSVGMGEVTLCLVCTVVDSNQRARTLTVFGDGANTLAVCDQSLKLITLLEGVDHVQAMISGTANRVVLSTLSRGGKLAMWNLSSLLPHTKPHEI